jgi:small nuclear ribonucleoprotein (snRNP)-like protein
MLIKAKDGGVTGLIDELISNLESILKKTVSVSTVSGQVYSGEIVARTPQVLILRQASESKIASGPNAGKSATQYTYISVSSVTAIGAAIIE